MCTVFTHPAVPIALSSVLPRRTVTSSLLIAGCICSAIPDIDTVGFPLGIRYGDLFGHRGFTHSITFALAIAALVTWTRFRSSDGSQLTIFFYLFLATLSHGVLDAFTNGGLGIAFFSPFSNERYFFPYRPIEVSKIGLHFFSGRGIEVLLNELRWVWLPCAAFLGLAQLWRYLPSAARDYARWAGGDAPLAPVTLAPGEVPADRTTRPGDSSLAAAARERGPVG